ncbi:DUF3558 family protein [Gordonia sp. (in: high G+C Gram-positive bacteria)]|uniref:DUF3558 family protein n=1 Tax=Gordonia sp. (in: high G+C Gram-positive bacteria) TaxID=84139 RepID=UPI0039E625A5
MVDSRTRVTAASIVGFILLCGCERTEDNIGAGASPSASRAPHAGAFPNRLNPGNDGTTYEPCTGSNEHAVQHLGWDWGSRRDAALVDKQTARGCVWVDSKVGSVWSVSQTVANSPSIAAFKQSNPSFSWHPFTTVMDRPAAVFSTSDSSCTVRVQSQRAGVSTTVDNFEDRTPPTSEICARAIAFTKATISRMPE